MRCEYPCRDATASIFRLFSRFSSNPHRYVTQVTSEMALSPHATLALYCSGKAARDMFFKVVAKEHPDVKVLQYSPGSMNTDLARKQVRVWNSWKASLFRKTAIGVGTNKMQGF